MEAAGEQTTLRRAISSRMLLIFVVGDILGAGIYALVGEVGAEVGGAVWTAFTAALILAVFTAFSQRFEALPRGESIELARVAAERTVERLAQAGVAAEVAVHSGPAADSVIEVADKLGADLIVVGGSSRGPVIERLLGSLPLDLVQRAGRQVLVVTRARGLAHARGRGAARGRAPCRTARARVGRWGFSPLESAVIPHDGAQGARHTQVMARTVLIVDDHAGFRASARRLLEAHGYAVAGEAEDGIAAIRAARVLSPEVVLLDVHLPDMSGLEVAARLLECADPPAVVLTSTRDAADFADLLQCSRCCGFVPKEDLSGPALAALLD